VGMPATPVTYTGTALWNRLVNERRIELAFEGHRFFDERRWLIAGDIENRPLRGIQITKDLATGISTYTPKIWLQKIPYDPKMNFIPIERSETRRESGVTQSPGW
jgi:starch-binding outer membrane protein, SusD/RagB family